MGRYKDSGTNHGTKGSPQTSLEQSQFENSQAKANQVLINTEEEKLFAELDRDKVKYTKENVLFITKDRTGQIVFLETGNEMAGFKHILKGHVDDFKRALNLEADQIPTYLKNVVRYGQVISNEVVIKKGRAGFSRKYYYNGEYYIFTGIGTNGFMISAYPTSK
ncbi:MAG: hypothetical protein IJ728_01095 [Selenomonadaceae bacterium]|nr:hypothetical protein [Selenomonadaceae bacterium]